MKAGVLISLALTLCSTECRADLIELVSNGSFATNLNGWNQSPASSPTGNWTRLTTNPPAVLPVTPTNGDVAIETTFTPGTVVLTQIVNPFVSNPATITSGVLQWDQFLTAAVGPDWSSTLRFRLRLNDETGNQFIAYSTDPGEPLTTPNPDHQSVSVLTFLQQLTSGEAFFITLESVTDSPVHFELDNISLVANFTTGTPEPASLFLVSFAGLMAVARHRRRRSRALVA